MKKKMFTLIGGIAYCLFWFVGSYVLLAMYWGW